jgi:hypothetical protein
MSSTRCSAVNLPRAGGNGNSCLHIVRLYIRVGGQGMELPLGEESLGMLRAAIEKDRASLRYLWYPKSAGLPKKSGQKFSLMLLDFASQLMSTSRIRAIVCTILIIAFSRPGLCFFRLDEVEAWTALAVLGYWRPQAS